MIHIKSQTYVLINPLKNLYSKACIASFFSFYMKSLKNRESKRDGLLFLPSTDLCGSPTPTCRTYGSVQDCGGSG